MSLHRLAPPWLPNDPDRATLLIAGAAVFAIVLLVRRVAWARALVSAAFTTMLVMLLFVVVRQHAAFDPVLDPIARRLGLDGQTVSGHEVRVPIAADGHYWARARIDGVPRRMLIDSGATVTALSPATAAAAGLRVEDGVVPVVLHTANGTIAARTARIGTLRLGDIVARDLAVVVSPGFGDTDVLGMNFLSRLKGWRVEDGTLVLTPHHPTDARR